MMLFRYLTNALVFDMIYAIALRITTNPGLAIVFLSLTMKRNAFSKGWESYMIMHKNRHVASIREEGTAKIYYPKFMPYNLWLETETDIDSRVNNLNNFYYWCASRVLTLDRKYAKEILIFLNIIQ